MKTVFSPYIFNAKATRGVRGVVALGLLLRSSCGMKGIYGHPTWTGAGREGEAQPTAPKGCKTEPPKSPPPPPPAASRSPKHDDNSIYFRSARAPRPRPQHNKNNIIPLT